MRCGLRASVQNRSGWSQSQTPIQTLVLVRVLGLIPIPALVPLLVPTLLPLLSRLLILMLKLKVVIMFIAIVVLMRMPILVLALILRLLLYNNTAELMLNLIIVRKPSIKPLLSMLSSLVLETGHGIRHLMGRVLKLDDPLQQ